MNELPRNLTADQKRELLAELLRRRQPSVERGQLSHGQRALWFVYRLDPQSSAYNILHASYVRADVNVAALERAFARLIDRHAALRTTYTAEEGQPLAHVHSQVACPFSKIDAGGRTDEQLYAAIHAEADQPLDLEQGPVLRICLFQRPESRHVLLLTAAHIALDFWSLDLMFEELAELYAAEVLQCDPNLAPASAQYADFVHWQEDMLCGAEGERLWNYWRDELSGPLPALDLPTDRPRPPVQTYRGDTYRFDLPDELTRRLTALAKAEGATMYMLMLAAFQTLLHRWSGQSETLVGSSTAGRNRVEWEAAVGYFLNVIVLRGRIDGERTFQDFLAQVRQSVLGALSHQDLPFPLLVQRLAPPRDVSRSPVFQVSFNWDRPRSAEADANDRDAQSALDLEAFELGQKGAAFDLTLVMLHRGDSLAAALQYNSDLFDRTTIERFAGQLQTLLEAVAENPRQPIAELPLLSRRERQMLLEDWNDTAAEYPRAACLHDLFTAQSAKTPDRIAVSHPSGELTYRQLDERSNRLARHLVQLGVGPDVLVGVYVDRSPEMLVALLGVLKAGGAYVPLAIGTPTERIASMLEESRAAVVITQRDIAADLPPHAGRTLCIDADWPLVEQESDAPLERRASPSNLAYVIFTSGSTGRPKGVQIEHRAVVNFLTLIQRRPGILSDDVLLAVTTLSFDISVLELFLPISVGARVVVADRHVTVDGRALAQLLRDSGATIVQATPATWRILIQAGWEGNPNLKILCGGEALPRDLAGQLLERCGSLWNMYGPTETTIWSSVDRVTAGEGPVPVGPPMANTQFYVLDGRGEASPIGIPGELYIGGDGVARGYLNRPELTAERFVPDPFHPEAGRRMFKAGDVVRYRPDGRLEFLGRSDFQVKVRGFRIELGEIEAVLAQHPAVRDSVVVARQVSEREDDKQLVAYFVSNNGSPPGAGELREFLKVKLPDYMVPAAFVALDALPLNPSGKVDRKALPEPEIARPQLVTEYVAPRSELEARLAETWQSVLGVERLGVNDDYFDLGGASMQSLEIGALAAESGLDIAPALLFQHPTVARLAAALQAQGIDATWSAEATVDAPSIDTPVTGGAVTGVPVDTSPRADTDFAEQSQTAPSPQPSPDPSPQAALGNTVIESLGVYLPPNEVTTDEVLRGCRKRVWFPLERMSGIQSRHMAGEGDYAVDLARKAIDRCLAYSKYDAGDVDLLVSCSITRGKSNVEVWVEPNISLQLKRHFGFDGAVAFDITNACGGMFTGMLLADAWISIGAARRAIVVSGEFITGITQTAQKEISSFLDSRIACLTVGDAGAAVLLEAGSGREAGFHELEMYSVTRYNKMCIGRLTEHPHGGPIMHVPDPIRHTSVSAEQSVMHALSMFQKSPWPPDDIQHLIIHQTSRRSLRDGMRAINKAFGRKVSHEGNTLDNLSHRANTGSTTHMVAMWDHILSGRVNSHENVFFAISGSGQTIGTGLYTLDDLPDRLREHQRSGRRPEKLPASAKTRFIPKPNSPRVHVRAIGTHLRDAERTEDTTVITTKAAENCLAAWNGDRNEIDLVLFAGMTRTGYIAEPAIATFIAGELKINDDVKSAADRKTLAFDVYNAALGTLNACDVAAKMIQAGKFRRALVTTSEIELNASIFPDRLFGLREAGSALLLEASTDGRTGFGSFVYRYATEHLEARMLYGHYVEGKTLSDLRVRPEIEELYLQPVRAAVDDLLEREGIKLSDITHVLPSQFSTTFNAGLAKQLDISPERIVDLSDLGGDLFTNSLPMSLQRLRGSSPTSGSLVAKPGDIGLIVNVASGIQAGCAMYYF